MRKLIAYHGDPKIKEAILVQLQRHYDADELIKGQYWENGKGCAVGCTIYSGNHIEYEDRFGIPIILAKLEDRLFERLPNALSKEWPIKFMSAINPGADLSNVWKKFVVWILSDREHGVIKYSKSQQTTDAIKLVCGLYEEWVIKDVDMDRFIEARNNADAADAADAAAAYAADAAYAAAAYAAYAADAAAAYAADAADAARKQVYIAQSEKLLELLREAK